MLKRKDIVTRRSERIATEVDLLEQRMEQISVALLASHVRNDRPSDLGRTSGDIRFLARTLGPSVMLKSSGLRTVPLVKERSASAKAVNGNRVT